MLWRHRARVIEAMVLLAGARVLVACVPFRRWSRWFGAAAAASALPQSPLPQSPLLQSPLAEAAALRSRRIGRAVDQAARHLPFACKCLPRAMAARLMLRRRAIPAALVVGVLPGEMRGTDDDLHAWVSCGGETIIGAGDTGHAPLLALQ